MDFVKKEKEKLMIYPNQTRIAIVSLVTALTTLFFIGLVGVSLDRADPRFLDYVLGILLAVYFGYLTIQHWLYLLKNRNKPALIIDKIGIWDNTLFSQVGSIAWQNIEDIFIYDLQLKSGGKERSLGIMPKTGQEFLQQFPLFWQIGRVAIAAFFRFPTTQTPINILFKDLQLGNSQEFEREIQDILEKIKHN
jgi:hypothetical protein